MNDNQRQSQIIADTLFAQHNGNYRAALEQINDEIRHAIHTKDSKEQSVWELAKTIVMASMEDGQLDMRLFTYDASFSDVSQFSTSRSDSNLPRVKSIGGRFEKPSYSKSRSRTAEAWTLSYGYRFHGRD